MILVAGGDSFIFGNELADWTNNRLEPSRYTYPALCADRAEINYTCCARPGNANDAIARMTIEKCETLRSENKKIIVFVSWTFPNRFEFPFEYSINSPTSPWASITPHQDKNANKEEVKDFARTFYKNVDSGWFAEYNSVKNIIMLQTYLKSNDIPYVFTAADNVVLKYRSDRALKPLWDLVDFDNWFLFPGAEEAHNTNEPRGFYQWAVENKYPVGPQQHPLEHAHQLAATLLQETINAMVKKFVQ
jgi:hypothetical protein